ncbi:hypothetical protein KCU80_g5161, partial [Aureobasidium melanogenum]
MPTPIEQALITLVPTLNSLPQELIDLSTSLLAQSRNKASSLKPEEEIGRTYTCAHIAVERLKHRLDIDKVVARPPVAPRIYKKLYGYLDAALKEPATPRTNRLKDVNTAGTPASGRGRRSVLSTPVGTPSKTPAKSVKSAGGTPSKTPASVAKSVESVTASGRRTRSARKATEEEVVIQDSEEERQKGTEQEQEKEDNLPEQVRPMAEAVCDALNVPQATPHVCAALSAILQLRGWKHTQLISTPRSSAKKRKRTSTDAEEVAAVENTSAITPSSLPALIAAISLVTTFTLLNTVIDGTTYATARSSAITALSPNSPTPKDVDSFLHASKTENWLELPWFTTVKASTLPSMSDSQTPKKNKPPAKTPLHRKEKHAPRPVRKDLDMDTVMEDVDAEAQEEDTDRPETDNSMTDQGDQTPRSGSNEQAPEKEPVTPSPPGIIITSAEDSTKEEKVKSSNDLLQASHDTEDDGALPKVRSEPTADAEPQSEEKPLVSPEDDEFDVSGDILERPVSPIDDEEEDEQSVASSRFSNSDSDEEERRGRARRSSRDRDMSPSRTFTTRFASQEHIEKETSDQRRSKEGLAKGERRHSKKSKSPLAIKSITRDGDTVIVTSPTHGIITITDLKVVEELADGQFTLSPVKAGLDISQDAQDAIERAFEKQEILKIAESYKNGPKHTPPPVPARPDSPQFGLSAGDAEASLQSNNPTSQHTKLPGVSAPAETGVLHRRSASKELSGQFLMQKRYDMIHGDMRKLAVNPSHRIGGWTKDDLWSFMRTQDNKMLSIAEVLHKNNLQSDIQGMITLQDERKFARSEVERIKSEFELQTIANEHRVAELETELVNAEAENERLLAMQTMDQSREAILISPVKLSPEANEALAKVEKHAKQINTKHEEVCKGMDELRSQLDLTQQLQADNKELRRNMELLENQVDFYDHQNEKLKHRMDKQELENDRITKAYKVLQKENAQLKTRVQNLQVENAELKNQLDICKSELEEDKLVAALPRVEPADSFFSTQGVGSEEESNTLRDSNSSLSGKVSALERILTSTIEESVKFKELYNAAEEQRVWSFAHYATVREPWPIATRETIAQLIVTVINDNRKPTEESSKPADAALNGRPARDLQFELTGLVEDAPLPDLLTKDQVVTWFAAGLGLPKIFEEIRTLGLHLDKETEQEILRVLIEQGLCYGNYDVFSTFVFADKPLSRKEFIARQTDMITVMDELEVKMLKTEADLKLAQDKVTELEQTDREQSTKLEEQDHDLKQARQALETFETYHGDPEGALEELIELRATHANLREELKEVEDANKDLKGEIAYYEKELVEARSEAESLGFALDDSADKGTCNISAHRDLEARIQDLEKQKQELVAHSRDQEVAAAQMPDSPACPHCHKMRRTIAGLNLKLREQKRQAVEARDNAGSPPISPSDLSASPEAAASAAPYCNDCAYLSKQLDDARRQIRDLEQKLRDRKNEVRGCNYETDKARRDLDEADEQLQKTSSDLADAQKEIQRLRSEDSSSSPNSTSTAPTSTGGSSARDSEKDDRIKELEALLEKSQQSLSEKINDRLTGDWGARKLAAPSADKQNDMWDSFDIEGNASKLAAEKAQLEEQVTALQKNLNMFEAAAKIWEDEANVTASQIENAESVALHARIGNLQRQVEVIPGLEERISTLVEEKKNLIGTHQYLSGDKRPECCLATRTELQKEIDAHAATRKELEDAVDAAATNMDNDISEEVNQELEKVKKELGDAKIAHALYVAGENNRYADLMVTKPGEDPCKDVRDELAALKIEHADTEDALRTTSVENENNKRLLRQARIQGSRIKTTGDAGLEGPCKEIRDELETTNTRLNELQRLLDEERARKPTNASAQQHGDLIKQIRDLEEQITKTRGAHNAQARIKKLVQRVRDDAVKIAELQFEIGKLEAISKAYVLAGDR